jgi:rubrerythrin
MHVVKKVLALLLAGSVIGLTLNETLADETILPQTREALKAAMQNEALMVLKYRVFADRARTNGKTELAGLLDRTADAEQAHFMQWAKEVKLVGDDPNNLASAIIDEYTDDMALYKRLAEQAEAAKDDRMAKAFRDIYAEEAQQHDDLIKAVSTAFKAQ